MGSPHPLMGSPHPLIAVDGIAAPFDHRVSIAVHWREHTLRSPWRETHPLIAVDGIAVQHTLRGESTPIGARDRRALCDRRHIFFIAVDRTPFVHRSLERAHPSIAVRDRSASERAHPSIALERGIAAHPSIAHPSIEHTLRSHWIDRHTL